MADGFDYIVVGAGSAGCVPAERLSADRTPTVLALEAGGVDRNTPIHMPKGMVRLVMNPRHTWYFPVAQPRVEREPASEVWVRGLALGGSSSINGMIYVHGRPEGYDEWAARGATGWGWDRMKAAFRSIEDHELGDDAVRGEDRAAAIAIMRYMRRYMAQPALSPYAGAESFPGAQVQDDDALFGMSRRLSTCGTHAVASCRMGSDNGAVVDPDLRVNGVAGLRIVDCSVMPSPVSGNTNAPAMTLAWAAAQRITSG